MNTIEKYGDDKTYGMLIDGSLDEFIDDELTSVLDYKFSRLTALTKIDAPISSCGVHAFSYCSNLNFFNFSALQIIADGCFQKSGLYDVRIDNISSIASNMFNYCENLVSVSIPNATLCGDNAFFYCTKLQNVDLPLVSTAQNNVFEGCSNLEKIVLPALKKVTLKLFYNCSKLKRIDLPSVTNIGGQYSLYTESTDCIVILRANSVATLQTSSIHTSGKYLMTFYVPDELVEDYKSATNWSTIASQIHPISELPEEE